MDVEVPLILKFFIFILPFLVFRVWDYVQFKQAPEREGERKRFVFYWFYSAFAQRNPGGRWLVIQGIWGAICILAWA